VTGKFPPAEFAPSLGFPQFTANRPVSIGWLLTLGDVHSSARNSHEAWRARPLNPAIVTENETKMETFLTVYE
jgi:hypothetical protein